ncbi:MAG: sigma-70 family RNA polymerase sigma factor [bacterium]|nr:sigma-70 family RNA polymerase sigma factor [bacterium]
MISTLTRIFGPQELDLVEEVVQEAFLKALKQWPFHGVPDNPSAWLIQVAKNRALDTVRRRANWRSKESQIERSIFSRRHSFEAHDARFADEIRDDELRLVFMCCHPALGRNARIALTLKMSAAFSTAEIARAFLARESAIAQRLVRAKRKLRELEVSFEMPEPHEMPARLDSVLESLYLIFNEGHSAHEGEDLVRFELCHQAIRLAELLADHPVTATTSVRALTALLLFQACRLGARTDEAGDPIRLDEQDRSLWDRRVLARGLEHFEAAAEGNELSRYHLEAEIASCHALAENYGATDWQRIVSAYDQLLAIEPSPVISLNRAIALSRLEGPWAGLEALDEVETEPALQSYYPLHATRAELLSQVGRFAESRAACQRALQLAVSAPVRRSLMVRLAETEETRERGGGAVR